MLGKIYQNICYRLIAEPLPESITQIRRHRYLFHSLYQQYPIRQHLKRVYQIWIRYWSSFEKRQQPYSSWSKIFKTSWRWTTKNQPNAIWICAYSQGLLPVFLGLGSLYEYFGDLAAGPFGLLQINQITVCLDKKSGGKPTKGYSGFYLCLGGRGEILGMEK